jgi:hypothetical protein
VNLKNQDKARGPHLGKGGKRASGHGNAPKSFITSGKGGGHHKLNSPQRSMGWAASN